jgi:MYXO-CTERM domain-containing protein
MMPRLPRAAALLLCLLLWPTAEARAASISGTIRDTKSSALQGMEVRLWTYSTTNKAWIINRKTQSSSSGTYTFSSLSAGTYKVDARMGPTSTGNYGDRWYDKDAPTGKGYIAEYADQIKLDAVTVKTGIDIVLESTGGIDTAAANSSGKLMGIQVRVEQKTEYRIHHNDWSQGSPHLGGVYFRGLVPADYRLLFHAPEGTYETLVLKGPFKVTAGVTTAAGTGTLSPMVVDPYEPNDAHTDKGASIDSSFLRQKTPVPYVTKGALIGPRNKGDTDWACFDVLAGDRVIISVDMPLSVEGTVREDPWMDPVVALYSAPSSSTGSATKIKEDDDSGPGNLDARLDTGVLTAAGRYCAVVSTFGDTKYAGATQSVAGRYRLTIAMGNRKPALTASFKGTSYTGSDPPAATKTLKVKEGDKLIISLAFSDVDGDTLTASMLLKDSGGAPVKEGAFKSGTGTTIPASGGTFTGGAGTASFTWELGESAAKSSPYALSFDVKDKEFTRQVAFSLEVTAVNHPPTVPAHSAPKNGSTVTTATPTLVINNSSDVDGDTLTYEFQIYHGGITGTPAESKSGVASGSGSSTSYTLTKAAPENGWIYWRARAHDGQGTAGYSAWSGLWSAFVDTKNDPPAAPVLVKPQDNSTVLDTQPTLAVLNPKDPEQDKINIQFEVARDNAFTQGLITSPAVAVNTSGSATTWLVSSALTKGQSYFARAMATDNRGGKSGYSNVNGFKVLDLNLPPDAGPQPDAGVADLGPQSDRGLSPDRGGSGANTDQTGCGCQTGADGAPGGLPLLLAGLGMLLLRRRRRRR